MQYCKPSLGICTFIDTFQEQLTCDFQIHVTRLGASIGKVNVVIEKELIVSEIYAMMLASSLIYAGCSCGSDPNHSPPTCCRSCCSGVASLHLYVEENLNSRGRSLELLSTKETRCICIRPQETFLTMPESEPAPDKRHCKRAWIGNA
jgi:hypothetical protein